jgi:alcohol dehydrogenase
MMKAAVYKNFNDPIEILSVPKPKLNSSASVIIQVMATGVCRSDWHGWKGHDDDIRSHGFPFIPGHELSGIIVEIGRSVKKLKIGDRVAIPFILSCGSCAECHVDKPTVCLKQSQPGFTMYGSFAEYVEITRADRNLRILPKGVTFVEAAALGCRFTTAYRAVVQQGLRIVDGSQCKDVNKSPKKITVCVFGCGGLGLSCIMIAKAFQKEGNIESIIAVDVSKKALDKALTLGADRIVNASSSLGVTDDDIRKMVMKFTNGLGADLTIDAAGFASTCENAVHTCRRGGRMVQVGLPIGGRPPQIPMGAVAGKELEIIGSHGFAASDLPNLLNFVQSGKLQVRKLIGKEVNLSEGVDALMAMDKYSPLGITVITRFDDTSRL